MSEEKNNWLADPTIPEPIRRALQSGALLERIELDSEGHFWHEGERIEDQRLCDLFHRSIQRTLGGSYLLVVAPFSYPLLVRDVPYWVRQLAVDTGESTQGPPRVHMRLSDDSEEDLAIDTLRYQPGRGFTCRVKGGTMPARFSRPCYFALAEYVTEDEAQVSQSGAGGAAGTCSEAAAGEIHGRLTLVLGNARHGIPVDEARESERSGP